MSEQEDGREPECPECPAGTAVIGVEVRGVYDGVLYWTCWAGHRWHRWPEGHYLRARAERFVDEVVS